MSGALIERKPMGNSQMDKAIGWAVVIIVCYHIVGVIVPFLTGAVIIIMVWRLVWFFLQKRL